jgi:hypothetical protein
VNNSENDPSTREDFMREPQVLVVDAGEATDDPVPPHQRENGRRLRHSHESSTKGDGMGNVEVGGGRGLNIRRDEEEKYEVDGDYGGNEGEFDGTETEGEGVEGPAVEAGDERSVVGGRGLVNGGGGGASTGFLARVERRKFDGFVVESGEAAVLEGAKDDVAEDENAEDA